MLELHKIIRVLYVDAFPIAFSFVFGLAGKTFQNYEKWSLFNAFSCLGLFPQVFIQVKEWLMLETHKIIRVSHVVACSIVFLLFYEQDC